MLYSDGILVNKKPNRQRRGGIDLKIIQQKKDVDKRSKTNTFKCQISNLITINYLHEV